MVLRESKYPKCNAPQVEAVFVLMFETLWLAPYDRRRRMVVYTEYEICIRHAVRLLSTTDLSTAAEEPRERLLRAIRALSDSVGRLAATGEFPQGRCREGQQIVARIERQIGEKLWTKAEC